MHLSTPPPHIIPKDEETLIWWVIFEDFDYITFKSESGHCAAFFKIFYFYLLLEKGEGREKEREPLMCERNINLLPLTHPQPVTWSATQACALTRNQTTDLLIHCPVLNALSHTSHGGSLLHTLLGPPPHFFIPCGGRGELSQGSHGKKLNHLPSDVAGSFRCCCIVLPSH